ncbi:MAG: FAD-binding oxidoreductase [Pseudolabrys sp.]
MNRPVETRMRVDPGAALAELAARFGNRMATALSVREQHAHTTTWVRNEPPDAVLYPQSAGDVQDAVRICARHGVPVIAFGTGTSFEGHVNAPFGGVCLDMRDMNRVLAVHAEDFDCVVEPGITRKALNEHLRDQGLFFPVDPGADASLGGMASTRASGTTAVRYGTMKDNVLSLDVVLPDGELITTARRARKSSAGYDLTRLFVGAEGTFGIITGLTLKLHGIPEETAAAVCRFPSIQACCDAAITAIQAGIPMARVEFLDEVMVRVVNADSKMSLPEQPMLFLEFHGTAAGVAEQSERFGEIAHAFGGAGFEWSARPEDRTRLWHARHHVFWGCKSYRAGAGVAVSDVCVPISRLAECVMETKADIARSGLIAPIVGHVGDGNFHAAVLVKMDDEEEVRGAEAFLERTAERALAMEGTCTGEHGIGQGKKHFMAGEFGEAGVALMRALKRAVDPADIMNPGKIV